jgi:glutathione S-transferase
LGAARVGGDLRVPERALSRAAALAGRPGRARGEDGARERFESELGFLEGLLEASPWLSGQAFGLADVAFLPWVLRAREMLGISLEPWPALAAWLGRASERPSVAAELELVASL